MMSILSNRNRNWLELKDLRFLALMHYLRIISVHRQEWQRDLMCPKSLYLFLLDLGHSHTSLVLSCCRHWIHPCLQFLQISSVMSLEQASYPMIVDLVLVREQKSVGHIIIDQVPQVYHLVVEAPSVVQPPAVTVESSPEHRYKCELTNCVHIPYVIVCALLRWVRMMVKASIIPSANGFGIIWVDKIVKKNLGMRERLEILLLESMQMGIISWVYGELI